MKALKIFCDVTLSDSAARLLRDGIAPHQLIHPGEPASSALADIAFGQPDPAHILSATRLRWVHLSSAGYTRYDNAEFRAAAAVRGLTVTNSSAVYAEA